MLREDRPVEVEENEKIEKKHWERKRITDKENQQLQETSKHLMTCINIPWELQCLVQRHLI